MCGRVSLGVGEVRIFESHGLRLSQALLYGVLLEARERRRDGEGPVEDVFSVRKLEMIDHIDEKQRDARFMADIARPRQRITRPVRQRKGLPSRDSAGHERPRTEWIEVPVPVLVSEERFALA